MQPPQDGNTDAASETPRKAKVADRRSRRPSSRTGRTAAATSQPVAERSAQGAQPAAAEAAGNVEPSSATSGSAKTGQPPLRISRAFDLSSEKTETQSNPAVPQGSSKRPSRSVPPRPRASDARNAREGKRRSQSSAPKRSGRDMFEERRRAEAEREAAEAAAEEVGAAPSEIDPAAQDQAILDAMVECQEPGRWRINGVYEQQIVNAGLRYLDTRWAADMDGPMTDFPRRPNGSSVLLRERTFLSLLTEQMSLKSMPASDVGAAQGDLQRLTLRQLLRLRTLHLDFNPGGSTTALGANVHAAFLESLEMLLFKKLGQKAAGQLIERDQLEDVKFGRELVLLSAASRSMAASSASRPAGSPAADGEGEAVLWWAWQLEGSRVFFNAKQFACTQDFPDGDVLEVKDYSKRDGANRHWLEWSIRLIGDQAQLGASDSFFGEGTPGGKRQPAVSADILQDALKGLKKTASERSEDAGQEDETF